MNFPPMPRLPLLFACLLPAMAFAADDGAKRESMKFFENEVRPLLANRCYECHGEKKKKGSLRMDNISFIKAGGDSGPALVAGNPDKSLIIQAVRYKDPDFEMPPKEKLPDKEIAILEKWVKLGAPWPETEATRVAVDEHGFAEKDRSFWSFQPLAKPVPPAVKGDWAKTPIDQFIAKKHAELNLTPAPEASRHELVRRLYFDLHGLPPTKAQADAFVQSTDPQAYEKLIDELLASPRFGERWAQHWLDLTRFAESDGYNQDAARPAAFAYRDYVIKSINADKPYDQFVREQLAGDEIDPKNPKVLVGVSYLRNPIYEYNQRDARGQYEVILTDMTDNAGEVFLGLSFGCAKCHDHKFDPILQKDYYRLRAFFTPVRWRDDMKLATDEEKARFAEQQAKWEEATKDIRAQIDAIVEPMIQKSIRSAYTKFTEDIRAMVDKTPEERTPEDWQFSYFCERQMAYERERFDTLKSIKKPEDKTRYEALQEELKKFDDIKPKPLLPAFIATDATNKAPKNILKTRKGENDIAPGYLTLLEPKEPKIDPLPNSTGRRSALANWITRPDNQLATRVISNRVWHYLFGRGIVATPNDLGHLGEPPTHPELLDYLTQRFLAGGWSLKKLHREILLSATYRQTAHRAVPEIAAKIDPTNKYLWRFNPRRLDAEQVRDAMLAASGELDLNEGGPSTDANGTRRSIYTTKKRNSQNELLRALDAPAGFASTSERQSTTTPTQALLLVNGDWPLARAQKLATRVKSVEEAWQYALGRPPTSQEMEMAAKFIEKRAATSAPQPRPSAAASENASEFRENTLQERLVARTVEEEGDEFTVEAVVKLDSIDVNAAVRTIASRWNNGKDNVEAFGWSLGVTGEKSRFKPRNLIIQFVGEDENRNIAYEPVASNLRPELGVEYHIVAKISCSEHTVTFQMRQLGIPDASVLTSVVPHRVRSGLSKGVSGLVIGGVNKRAPAHQWDGRIEAARVVRGLLPDGSLSPDPAKWAVPALVTWNAKVGASDRVAWASPDSPAAPIDPRKEALADLCHVLLNANEFFYLH
ncbi:MAG: PSD1 and planctomycete cytochrome C domain-containing protein [Chthoniobacteraceae bacterium]